MKRFKQLLQHYWPLICILIVAGFLLIFRLNRDLLWDWDECLYSVYAREMRQTGNFLTNQWNGILDFQKPPLYTWLMQIPYSFGINEFTVRILSVIFGLGLLAAVYVFAKKYFSTIVAVTAILLILASQTVVTYMIKAGTDLGFSLFIFLGFYCWVLSFKKSRNSYLSGLFFGTAVMIKGLGSLQFLFAIFLSLFLNFKREHLINYLRVIGIFLMVIIPWHAAEYMIYGNKFIQIYWWDNIIKRATNPIEFHLEGRLFYIKLLFSQFFPWLFVGFTLPIIYLLQLKKYLNFKAVIKELKNNELIFTIILLIVVPLILLTRVRTRIAWYAIPLFPFITLYFAYNIELFLKKIKLEKLIYLVILFATINAVYILNKEIKFFQSQGVIDLRNAAAIQTTNYPPKNLDYLVQFSERQAKAILPPSQTIFQTFIFGGNPCAVYYSRKHVNYYYDIDTFKKELTKQNGLYLYLIQNGDLDVMKNLKTKTLYTNTDFTLFTKD